MSKFLRRHWRFITFTILLWAVITAALIFLPGTSKDRAFHYTIF